MKPFILATISDFGKMVTDNPVVSSIVAGLLWFFGVLYGNGEIVKAGMAVLGILVIIDWISGTSAAKKDGTDTSQYGIEGIKRTVVLLMIPALTKFLDIFLYTQGFLTYFAIAALARSVTKSVIANMHRTGWSQWIPISLLEYLIDWVSSELAAKEQRAKERQEAIYQNEGKQNNEEKEGA